MSTATQKSARWIDPVPAKGARPVEAPSINPDAAFANDVDRFHNLRYLAPEEMARTLADLQVNIEALNHKVSALSEADAAGAVVTRQLGLDVVEMGGALARRMRSLEERMTPEAAPAAPALFAARPVRRRKEHTLALTLGLVAAIALVLAGFWAWRGQDLLLARVALPTAAAASAAPKTAPAPTATAQAAPTGHLVYAITPTP